MDKFFKLKENGTTVKTEIVAGATTFLTMAYILFVNPSMLALTGMDKGAVFVATILAAVIGTLVMGLVANVPFVQAPGMGLNAFFTFTVVFGMGFTWQQALALVFICGIINIIITTTSIRKTIIKAIPTSLQYAISGGIGLFIAYCGLKQAHLINFTVEAPNAITEGMLYFDAVPSLTNFTDPIAVIAIIGVIITIVLMLLKVKSAILLGILLTTVLGMFNGVTTVPAISSMDFGVPSLAPTFLKLDLKGLFSDPSKLFLVFTTIFAFSLSDTFDTIGTFLGTGRKAGIFDANDEELFEKGNSFSSKLERALFADATATSIGALLGTSNTTTFVESAAGIGQGGRTGLTSVTAAALFLVSLFLAPIMGMVPGAATAPALIVVGILMMDSLRNIEWGEFEIAVPAFFIITFMPFTYSISNGVAAGFISYCIVKICKKEAKDVHPVMYICSLLFLLNFFMQAI